MFKIKAGEKLSIDAGGVYSELVLDTGKFNMGISEAGKSMEGVAGKMEKMGSKMQDVGKGLTKKVTVPIAGAAAMAVKLGSDFGASMSEVGAISGATGEDMKTLEKLAREMGSTTKFSASDAADGLKYMAMAGWETQEMMDGLPGILALAAASGEELGLTSDIVTDSLTGFGMKANEASHFADVLAKASSSSNTNVALMGETFKYVAPVAGALGFSVEDTALAVGLMANAGIKGSQAGTALRAALTNLVKPTDKMEAMMDSLGISVVNSDGSMKSLNDIMVNLRGSMKHMTEEQKAQTLGMIEGADAAELGKVALQGLTEEEAYFATAMQIGTDAIKDYSEEQLNSALAAELSKKEISKMTLEHKELTVAQMLGTTALEGLTEAEQAQAAATIFGKEAMSGMLAIVNASDEDFNNLKNGIDNATGSAEEMAAMMQDNLKGRWTEFKSLLEETGLKIYDTLLPSLEKLLEKGGDFLDWFNELDEGSRKTVLSIAGIAAATGPLLLVGGKLASSVGAITKLFGGLSGAGTVAAEATTMLGSSFGTAGGAASAGAFLLNPWVVGAAAVAGGAVLIAKHLKEDSIPAFEIFDETISETTESAISNMLDLEREGVSALNTLAWSGAEVSEEMKLSVTSNTDQMADDVIAKLTEQKEESLIQLAEMLENTTTMSEEEKTEAIRIAGEKFDGEIEKAEAGKKRIAEILEEAKKNNTGITEEERVEIEGIMDGLKENSITIMTESEEEQTKILEGLKKNSERITAEMASDVIKNSLEQKNETIANADQQYEEILKTATLLKKDGTAESIELADNMIAEADRQRKGTIKNAEDMHQGVLDEVTKQGADVIERINIDNGDIMTKWDTLKQWFHNTPIVRWIETAYKDRPQADSSYAKGGGSTTNSSSSYPYPGKNAQGTNYWQGGKTWVGEFGPEIIEAPEGTKIHSNQKSMDMLGSQGAITNEFTVHATIREESDIKKVANALYELQERNSRGKGIVSI